jgi:hypothetical protein
MKETATEQHTLKNINNSCNTNISVYLETSGGQNSNLFINAVYFSNTSVNKTSVAALAVFLHRSLICAVVLCQFIIITKLQKHNML